MKVLFFHATAGHPKVAPPLMDQAWKTLRPFTRFLGQAIHTAKERQTRYQLPWEKVRNLLTIRLDPVDSLLRIPRKLPGVVLGNWPVDKEPDLSQLGFVVNRSVPFRVQTARPMDSGLRVKTDVLLFPSDDVFWCGVRAAVEREAAPPPPRDVRDLQGRPLKLAAPPRADDDDRYWLLLVEGEHGDCDLVVDGEEVEAEALTISTELHRVVDQQGRSFQVHGGILRVEEPPTNGLLKGDNGIRYRWSEGESSGRRGNWIQLLPPESSDAEEFIDPRAAFCEGDLEQVWTQPRYAKDTTFKVKKVDQDRYQLLLDRYPPESSTLYLPVDQRNLQLQRRALRQLADAPLPHHQGLLRLCENPDHVRWPSFQPVGISEGGWRALRNTSRSGTNEQRAFVSKALGTKDFAFLQGPPGSGKTTAICEIVQQLVEQGQRVLLCASTHVAIDNVLERLLESDSPIYAVRIGKIDKIDDKVHDTQLDARIEKLVSTWRDQPAMRTYGDAELVAMAERTVIMAANLTCGTTMGIVNHPLFRGRDEDLNIWERPISTMPHWDVLIVDEASKTLIQEFLVPALMAKRWIIVGDVRQLPPFTDRADIVANLRDLVDENDKPVFPQDHQRACLLLFSMLRYRVRQRGLRWLMVERPGVLEWVARELQVEPEPRPFVVRVIAKGASLSGPVDVVTVAGLRAGKPEALKLAAADWVLVADDLLPEVADLLPSNLLLTVDVTAENSGGLHEGNVLLMRHAWWLARSGRLHEPYPADRDFAFKHKRDSVTTFAESETCEAEWLSRHTLANELAWRLTRLHELRYSRKDKKWLRDELGWLQPLATSIAEPIAEIEDIGLPSIIEVLQEGIGVDRSTRRSALTIGLAASRPNDFAARFESLTFQHRMHAEIAQFSREIIYEGQALKDANTIQIRDNVLGWDFGRFPSRRAWANVDGHDNHGVNRQEIDVMASILRDFIDWVRRKGPPNRALPRVWEVACLCFYSKQERAISEKLYEVTGDNRKTRFQVRDLPIEIVCGTVDRFQGREADLVMLSMRNTGRIGFLDSPNRLNVALTRARQQLVILGKHSYYLGCNISELKELAGRTLLVDHQEVRRWARSKR